MRDFKFLTAFATETCRMCSAKIPQGEGFYYEATKKEPHCKGCGRLIRSVGYDRASIERNELWSKLLRGLGI